MPEIIVKITQGSSEVSNKATEVTSSDLLDLLTSMKEAKEETNAVLTKLVEQSKEQSKDKKQARNLSEAEDDDVSCSEEDEARPKKKQSS